MNNRIYAEKTINTNTNFEQTLILNKSDLLCMLHNEESEPMEDVLARVEKIKNGEKISLSSGPITKMYYLASEEEIENALKEEEENQKVDDEISEIFPDIKNAFNDLFNPPLFED